MDERKRWSRGATAQRQHLLVRKGIWFPASQVAQQKDSGFICEFRIAYLKKWIEQLKATEVLKKTSI